LSCFAASAIDRGILYIGTTMPGQKASNDELISLYRQYGSIWKTAESLGMCGQSVHERLVKLKVINKMRFLSEEEKQKIINLYSTNFINGDGYLNKLSLEINRTKNFICRYAKSIGLTNQNRPCNDLLKKNISERTKEYLKKNGHPRGFLGGHHTEKTKDKISLMQIEYRKKNNIKGARPRFNSSWKCGWRDIGGKHIFYRSRWEANYARYLQFLKEHGNIKEWEHESQTFWFNQIKRGVRSYLPDFKITENNGEVVYHEVKGWLDKRSITIFRRMKIYYPEIKLIVIDGKWFKSARKNIVGLISDWESQKE